MLKITFLAAAAVVTSGRAVPSADPLASFNLAFTDATLRMDNTAALALWEDDGIGLLPGTSPLIGKAQIGRMLASVSAAHPKAHMDSFSNKCFDARIAGDWASEWCIEHQVISEPGAKTFDSWGKMLLVLHRRGHSPWRLSREMWNEAVQPAPGASEPR